MAGKSYVFSNVLLKLIFQAVPITDMAENAASSSAISDLFVSLHTADPGPSGNQSTHEVTYTGYARAAVARTALGWTVTSNAVSPYSDIEFPVCTGGSETATHFGIGVESSGAGDLLYFGPLSPRIAISSTVIPKVKTASNIAEN